VRHGKNRVAATGIPAADHEFMQFRVAAEDLHPSKKSVVSEVRPSLARLFTPPPTRHPSQTLTRLS
jgi:hypothetical protein